MEDEIIEIYEYNDQTLELSLVTEEEIPEALEVVRDTFERTKNRKCKVFRLESDEKMRSYMTDKGFAVKAMRYGEMVAVFVVQTEGVDKILAETGLELSEEERKSAALIYSWYPMTYIRNGEGVPVRLINEDDACSRKSDVGQRYPLCGRNYRLWSYTGNGNIWAQQI